MTNFLKNLQKLQIISKFYQKLPESTGIYIFYNQKTPIYIGKANNLRQRVASYFDLDLHVKTAKMISEARELSYIQVASELEALLLEAKLIRTHMPKYNVISKDDKHALYIGITKEEFPRVLPVRKLITNNYELITNFGPFPSSTNVYLVLKMIRKIFPYSDHKIGKRACLYSHIGLCNPCPSKINGIKNKDLRIKLRADYLNNINHVKSLLNGNIDKVMKNLVEEMKGVSNKQNYEEAAEIRVKIERLEYITRPQIPTESYLRNPNLYEDQRKLEIESLKNILTRGPLVINKLSRIECFDVAHLSGTNATASMVTFIDGVADKSLYRHFKIKQRRGNSDIDSMKEVVSRRIKHIKDWGRPDLIIVDGGIGQVKAFTTILYSNVVKIPVVGIAKNPDRLIVGDQKIKLTGLVLNLVTRIRDEAHRFARRYHHKLVSKNLLHPDVSI